MVAVNSLDVNGIFLAKFLKRVQKRCYCVDRGSWRNAVGYPYEVRPTAGLHQKFIYRSGHIDQVLRRMPLNLGIGAEPGELAFGKSPGVAFERSNAFISR